MLVVKRSIVRDLGISSTLLAASVWLIFLACGAFANQGARADWWGPIFLVIVAMFLILLVSAHAVITIRRGPPLRIDEKGIRIVTSYYPSSDLLWQDILEVRQTYEEPKEFQHYRARGREPGKRAHLGIFLRHPDGASFRIPQFDLALPISTIIEYIFSLPAARSVIIGRPEEQESIAHRWRVWIWIWVGLMIVITLYVGCAMIVASR